MHRLRAKRVPLPLQLDSGLGNNQRQRIRQEGCVTRIFSLAFDHTSPTSPQHACLTYPISPTYHLHFQG